MWCKKLLSIGMGIFAFVFIISFVSAVPQLTIHSPQNMTYNSTKILVNVTSNEVGDFFLRNERTGERQILSANVTGLETYIYASEGNHSFNIFMNSSVGVGNQSVNFSTTLHNPVNVTSCGFLSSSDTKYVLNNDISHSINGLGCIYLSGSRNVSFNLNGHTITAARASGLSVRWVSDIEIFNGTVNGSATLTTGKRPYLLDLEGTKLRFENLIIDGHIGALVWGLNNVVFENVTMNSSIGFWFYGPVTDTYFINSSIMWNGKNPHHYTIPSGFLDWSSNSIFTFENSTVGGFPEYDFNLEGAYTDYYLRNSNIDISKVSYPNWVADTRFIEQHLIIINVTDQFGVSGACSVRILDNGLLPRYHGLEAKLKTLGNPTADIYIPVEETGEGQEWVTEKITLARSSSPAVITEYEFSNYTLTTRGWGSDNYSQITLDLTDHNSTIRVDFPITTPSIGEELPNCTITQMFDLNNDGVVNIQDAIIVLRFISGKDVSVSETSKGCEGINLNPF